MDRPPLMDSPTYRIDVFWSDDDGGYIANVPDLKYCSAFGETYEEALREVLVAMELHLETLREMGRPIPEPKVRSTISPSEAPEPEAPEPEVPERIGRVGAEFELYRDQDNPQDFRWRLRANNGEIIADSGEGYNDKDDALHGIELVKAQAPSAVVQDLA
jgi:predicted RNase H-like HicB family nuclease/uncharacterized protein YegP (UPF0339 family)